MRLLVVITDFKFKRVKQAVLPVEYSSKQQFLDDFADAVDGNNPIITLWHKNGNDNNYNRDDFFRNGQYYPPIVFTVDEFFDGRDESECRTRISVSSHTTHEVNQRPIPRKLKSN